MNAVTKGKMYDGELLQCQHLLKPNENVLSDFRGTDPYVSYGWTKATALPFIVTSAWIHTDKPSNTHHRSEIVHSLLERTKGHWYYALEIEDYAVSHQIGYRIRQHLRFELRDDAMMCKLAYL